MPAKLATTYFFLLLLSLPALGADPIQWVRLQVSATREPRYGKSENGEFAEWVLQTRNHEEDQVQVFKLDGEKLLAIRPFEQKPEASTTVVTDVAVGVKGEVAVAEVFVAATTGALASSPCTIASVASSTSFRSQTEAFTGWRSTRMEPSGCWEQAQD